MDYTLTIEKVAVVLFFIMFIYSGFQKIFNFSLISIYIQGRQPTIYSYNLTGHPGRPFVQ